MTKEKQLLKFFASLADEDQAAVVNFAGYLYQKNPRKKDITEVPLDIERPDQESVVGAIKRLKKTYPMIESMEVFNKASELLSAHMLQGRDKKSVIDDLEELFKSTYENRRKNQTSNDEPSELPDR